MAETKPAVCQIANDQYPHYLAVLENGISRVVNIWAVREKVTERSQDNSERLVAENDAGDAFEVNRSRLCACQASAILALTADISQENRYAFETAIEHGNRELFESMAKLSGRYVEGAIDAAWCQIKAAELMAEPKRIEEAKAMMLETVRNYVEHRLRPFGEHLAGQIERQTRSYMDGLFLVLSDRLGKVEGQLHFLAQILKPTEPKAAKTPSKKRIVADIKKAMRSEPKRKR
jgi:hypothetical protein